jgi:large subunit ribosomal protein L6
MDWVAKLSEWSPKKGKNMSRIAKMPIPIPAGVQVEIEGSTIKVSGPKGILSQTYKESDVAVKMGNNEINVSPSGLSSHCRAMSGTIRSLVSNMVHGVTSGFEKKLSLVGVGYKAQAKGSVLNLALGFSHPVNYEVPKELNATTPSPTEIIISGADKQKVGQVAAEIRSYRPPEPYKGKGVRYSDEIVLLKETKKK